jgi:hypothetical protein
MATRMASMSCGLTRRLLNGFPCCNLEKVAEESVTLSTVGLRAVSSSRSAIQYRKEISAPQPGTASNPQQGSLRASPKVRS